MAQTIHFVDPVVCTPGSANAWVELDLDTYVAGLGADVTGVIIHAVQTSAGNAEEVGLRKEGSTDALIGTFSYTCHSWMGCGVDASHIFEAYIGSTTNVDLYIVAYTTTGFTWLTNGVDLTPGGTGWQEVDASASASGATGLVFDATRVSTQNTGFREATSTDNRVQTVEYHWQAWIKCTSAQLVDISLAQIGCTTCTLVGYTTDGVTWQTNAISRAMTNLTVWEDITLTAGGAGGIIECHSSTTAWGLRDNGSAEEILQGSRRKSWAVVESTSDVIEGYISNVALDFWEHGITEPAAGGATPQAVGNASMTIAATLIKKTISSRFGNASMAIEGTVTKKLFETVGGASVAIASTATGAVIRARAVGGATVAIAGSLAKKTGKQVLGTMTIAGTLTKKTATTVGEATLAIAGVLATAKFKVQAVGGASVTIAGAVTKSVGKTIGGASLSIAGTLAKKTQITIGDASMTISSTLTASKKSIQAVGGASVAIAGAMTWAFVRLLKIVTKQDSALTITSSISNALTIEGTEETSLSVTSDIDNALSIESDVDDALNIDIQRKEL